MAKPFAELRVVEIAGSHAGAFAAKLFGDYGAQVVKIIPPDGDPLLHHGEILPSHALGDAEVGSIWAFCNTSKRILSTEVESESVRTLIESADVVIESSAPDPLVPRTAEFGSEQLVRVCISPFGLSGPWASRRSNVFTDDAASGHMYLNGEADREPFRRTWAAYGVCGGDVRLHRRDVGADCPRNHWSRSDGGGVAPRGDGGDASAHDHDVDARGPHPAPRGQRAAGHVAPSRRL